MAAQIKRYIGSHWRGEQGLAWSFLVNLVGLRGLIFLFQTLLTPGEYEDYHQWRWPVLVLAFFLHGVVFIWQAVGVFRAGEAHIRNHGGMTAHWGAQAGVLAGFWLTAIFSLQAWQMTIDVPEYVNYAEQMEAERTGRYSAVLDANGTLKIDGTLELGVTRKLTPLFTKPDNIKLVELKSEGGNIYEARGLARLIRETGAATLVSDACASACTTIFIAGSRRLLRQGARLGFHQYRIETDKPVLANSQQEEARDREAYLAAGVKPEFVERMHHERPEAMWYPAANELLDAGVVTEIVD